MLSILYSFLEIKKEKSLREAPHIQIRICSHSRRKERKGENAWRQKDRDRFLAPVNAKGKKDAAKKECGTPTRAEVLFALR